MTEKCGYWTRGQSVYRYGRGVGPEVWGGRGWVPHLGFLGELLNGATEFEEITEAEALARLG